MEEILIILVCLVVNALFACFEMAFVTVNRHELKALATQGSLAAAQLIRLRQNPERTLSVVQIGITLVGIISAAAGGAGAEESFSPFFERAYGLSESTAEAISIALVVVPLTFLNVIFGELIPKAIALRNPASVAVYGVRAIAIVDRIFKPIVWCLEITTHAFLRLMPRSRALQNVDHVASVDIDHLSQQTQQYVLNLVGIEQRKVSEIMIAWDKIDFVETNNSSEQVTQTMIRSGHTRLPVIQDGKVFGLLHTKEFLSTIAQGLGDWRSVIRPIISCAPTMRSLAALKMMQDKHSHLVVIVKGETPIGIVTFEDVLEEIVGEFFDEDDDGRVRKLLSSQPHRRGRQ